MKWRLADPSQHAEDFQCQYSWSEPHTNLIDNLMYYQDWPYRIEGFKGGPKFGPHYAEKMPVSQIANVIFCSCFAGRRTQALCVRGCHRSQHDGRQDEDLLRTAARRHSLPDVLQGQPEVPGPSAGDCNEAELCEARSASLIFLQIKKL